MHFIAMQCNLQCIWSRTRLNPCNARPVEAGAKVGEKRIPGKSELLSKRWWRNAVSCDTLHATWGCDTLHATWGCDTLHTTLSCDTLHATRGVVIHCTWFLVHIKRVQESNFDQGTIVEQDEWFVLKVNYWIKFLYLKQFIELNFYDVLTGRLPHWIQLQDGILSKN